MFRVFIWAADQMYQGAGGMEDCTIEKVYDWNEANCLGEQMSYDIINSYASIYEEIEEQVAAIADDNMTEAEYEFLYEETAGQDLYWSVWKINEEAVQGLSEVEIWNIIDEEGWEKFVENYCYDGD